jgi:hypothetical protein
MYIVFVYIMCFVTVLLFIFLFIAFRDAVTESFPGVSFCMLTISEQQLMFEILVGTMDWLSVKQNYP